MDWGLYDGETLVSSHNSYIEALHTALSHYTHDQLKYDVKAILDSYEDRAKALIDKTILSDACNGYFGMHNNKLYGATIKTVDNSQYSLSILVEVIRTDGKKDFVLFDENRHDWQSVYELLVDWTKPDRPLVKSTSRKKPYYDMSNLQLAAIAVTDQGYLRHKEPVTSIDDAKQKLDALNVGMPTTIGRYHGQVVPLNNPEVMVWVDPVFGLSDLDAYFTEIDAAGGYVSHDSFTRGIGGLEFQKRKGKG